ncbi:MAG: DUF6273 domain-containing protein [Eubacteriales bacterium]|nr:DUF6273 domain-containing protein [Eubacteriales bacterium]
MGAECENHYKKAQELLETVQVLIQPKDISEVYEEAAKEMEAAGDYQDAQKLSREYASKAVQILEEGNERLYQSACEKMDHAVKEAERKLAADMFQRISGYKDADELAMKCLEKNSTIKKKNTLFIWIASAVVAIVVIAAICLSNQPIWKYREAEGLFSEEKYDEAKNVYEALSGYRDSLEKAQLCTEMKKEKNRRRAVEIMRKAKNGDEVEFGKYRWVILDKDENSATLLAVQVEKYDELKAVQYHEKNEPVTWEESSLREWLNSDFLENGFNELEREQILLTDVENEDNEVYHTDGGNDTQDYVYLLSMSEAVEYQEMFKFNLNWLLRTPGNAPDTVVYMTNEHGIMEYGCPVDWNTFFIRPVINVDLQS